MPEISEEEAVRVASRARTRLKLDPDMDITPMIDMTFLLLIFFLVTSIPSSRQAISLPPARHGTAVSTDQATILTVGNPQQGEVPVYLADGLIPDARLSDDLATQSEQIRQAVYDGIQQGKNEVLIKAEAAVPHREVARVVAAASRVEGIRLHVGVLELK